MLAEFTSCRPSGTPAHRDIPQLIGSTIQAVEAKGIDPFYILRTRLNLLLVGTVIFTVLGLTAPVTCFAQTNVLTYHNDSARTGQNLSETILKLSNLNSTNFGKLGFLAVDGLVDGQPLYVSNLTVAGQPRNVVFVVTEHDSVYAFDADTFAQLWRVTVLGTNEITSDARSCSQVSPEIGISSTPVIDPNAGPNGTIFVVGMTKNGSGQYFQRLHALDLSTGAELGNSPTTIQATFPIPNSTGHVTFDPGQYKERAGLLLQNGLIYLSWASHCDYTPYAGWVMSYSESTLQQVNVLNLTPSGSGGAIWMSGAGLATDSSGNIYALDGNGDFDSTLDANGFPFDGDFGNAFLKLSTASGLTVADYFEMDNESAENNNDTDLGSGGALVLPDMTDNNGKVWHLAVGAGKDQVLYVVNRDQMGKFSSSTNNIYQQINGVLPGGIWSMPAYFNNTVYYGPVGSSIRAFSITNALLSTSPTSQTSKSFVYPGATPAISANGTSDAILWAVENNSSTAVLHAYNATNLATELYNSNQASGSRDHFGAGNKFITPTITNGKVYVGTSSGVAVFGLLNGGISQTANPTFSPAAGTITSAQQITISDGTSGATIYYTTDGSTPTATASEQYTAPFTLAASATVQAMAVATGYANSAVASASYTVTAPPTLVSIAVTPANSSLVVNGTSQYTATGTYSDNSTQNLTSSATWVSTTTSTATINSAGLATGVAAGTTTIQATSGSVTGSTGLTVTTAAQLPSGLVGRWTFDDGTGSTAADASGNGYTATLFNGVAWTAGRVGGAISANGVNQYVSIPVINLSTTSAVTVAAWVNRTYSTVGGHTLFESSTNYNNSTTGFGVFPDDSACKGIQASVHGNVGYSVNCYSQPSSGAWHHLVFVFDKSQPGNNEVNLYIDGILQTPTQHYLTNNNTNAFGSNATYLFSRGGASEFTSGMMDDLQIYNRALSATEIQGLP